MGACRRTVDYALQQFPACVGQLEPVEYGRCLGGISGNKGVAFFGKTETPVYFRDTGNLGDRIACGAEQSAQLACAVGFKCRDQQPCLFVVAYVAAYGFAEYVGIAECVEIVVLEAGMPGRG